MLQHIGISRDKLIEYVQEAVNFTSSGLLADEAISLRRTAERVEHVAFGTWGFSSGSGLPACGCPAVEAGLHPSTLVHLRFAQRFDAIVRNEHGLIAEDCGVLTVRA